jgi:predicted PhzF superfamily epimerase YddE/YHI9
VTAYLRHFGAFDEFPDELVYEQGHFLDRPGHVRVRVGHDIEIGGQARTVLDGSIVVPPAAESDDIIEA